MTIYVLEGPDFAGKTTLAKNIMRTLMADPNVHDPHDINMVHNGPPKEGVNLFVDYIRQIWRAVEDDSVHTIFDRLHIGEAIYGPRFRGESALSFHQLTAIDELLDALDAVKIFVDAEDIDLLHRFRGERGDDMVNDERQLIAIAEDYRQRLHPRTEAIHNGMPYWIHWTPRHSAVFGQGAL